MGGYLSGSTEPEAVEETHTEVQEEQPVKAGKRLILKSKRKPKEIVIPSKSMSSISVGFQVDSLCKLSSDSFAVGLSNGVIQVYQMSSTSGPQYTLTGHTGTVKTMLKLADGRLCSGGGDSAIKMWRLYEKRLDAELTPHSNWVSALLQLKGSELLISGSSDNTIKVINLSNSNAIEHTFNVDKNIDCLVDIGEGQFASNSGDSVVIWDTKSKEKVYEFEGALSSVMSLAFLDDGRLFTGAVNGNIKIYDIHTKKKLSKIKDSGNLSVIKTIGKNTLAVALGNGIKLWNLTDNVEIRTLSGHSGDVKCLELMDNGTLISGGTDKCVKLWE